MAPVAIPLWIPLFVGEHTDGLRDGILCVLSRGSLAVPLPTFIWCSWRFPCAPLRLDRSRFGNLRRLTFRSRLIVLAEFFGSPLSFFPSSFWSSIASHVLTMALTLFIPMTGSATASARARGNERIAAVDTRA
jgi:hypothetical protein